MIKTAATATALALAVLLVGCTPDEYQAGGAPGSSTSDESAESTEEVEASATEADGRVVAPGMPGLPLVPCGTADTYTVQESSVDTMWTFVYTCEDRSAFDESRAALATDFENYYDEALGDESYISDKSWFRAFPTDTNEINVNLSLVGFPGDELELTYIVIDINHS